MAQIPEQPSARGTDPAGAPAEGVIVAGQPRGGDGLDQSGLGAEAGARVSSAKARLAEEAERLSEATSAAADAYRQEGGEGLAAYANDLSDRLSRLGRGLRDRSVEDLAHETRRIARENPAAFLVGSIAIGFALSRFFKASKPGSDDSATRSARSRGQYPPTTGGIA